jgi:arylformamidase
MSANLFDLSPPIDGSTPVWPGDRPFTSLWTARLSDSSPINLSAISTTVHLGSHADAPLHTEPNGHAIDAMPLAAYVGPCQVVAPSGSSGSSANLLAPEDLPLDLAAGNLLDPPRILIKTGSVTGMHGFPATFTALSPELARALAAAGALLVATDAPSIDPFDSTELPAHHALLGTGVAVLEGLRLDPVPPGRYELIALPLLLRGLDASPVRAVLRRLDDGRSGP